MFDKITEKLDQAIDEKGIKTNVVFEFTPETYTSIIFVGTILILISFAMKEVFARFLGSK